MSDESKSRVAAVLRRALERRRWSAARLAREAGVSASTITRALDPSIAFVPSTRTLEKLSPFLDEEVLESAEMSDEATLAFQKIQRKALEFNHQASLIKPRGAALAPLNAIPLVGPVSPGLWKEVSYTPVVDPLHDMGFLWISAPGFPSEAVAFEFSTDRHDAEYRDADYLIVDRGQDGERLITGDVAVVYRELKSPHLEECTLADVELADGVLVLHTRGPNPEALDLHPGANPRTSIAGPVVATIRLTQRPRSSQ